MVWQADRMRLSTIITTYNSNPAYLAESLRCIEQQTVQPDEVLLVDDGSERPAPIPGTTLPLTYLKEPHAGIGATKNAGLRQARGRFIHVWDDDDRLHPEFYSRLLPLLEAGADIAFAPMTYMDASGQPMPEAGQFPPADFTGSADWFGDLLKTHRIPSGGCVFRRTVWETVGGFTTWRTTQDWRFFLDAARHGARFEMIPEPLMEYRRHPAQITHEGRRLETLLECAAMIAQLPVPLNRRWQRSHTVARWRLEASRVASSRWQQAVLLGRGGWRRPRTAIAAARGRWG